VVVASCSLPVGGRAAAVPAKKILVLGSYAPSLVRFRGPLLRDLVAAGYQVVGCASEDDSEVAAALAGLGATYRSVRMDRAGTDPVADLRTLGGLVRLLRAERPDVLLAYTQKPMVYGGIAARLAGVPRFFAMVTGLGYAFAEGPSLGRRLLRKVTAGLFRPALRHAEAVFYFNPEDRAQLERHGIVRPGQRLVRVDGSGVDTAHYAPAPLPEGPPVFLLVARLLRDKGLREYVEAARMLRTRWPAARFRIVGPLDANPTSITAAELAAWKAEGVVEYLGETNDVRPYLRACTVFVLPSYYHEGVPRSVLEAMATGRAIVTTDWQGCRETVAAGENGFLVPVRDPAALAVAMARFLEDPGLARRMGQRSLEIVDARFDVRRINAVLLATMGLRSDETPAPPQV
jgi:glycosyltransferase involved in cell wall biosynthesis